MALIRDCYAPFEGLSPEMIGLEDCDSLSTHLKTWKPITEKNAGRYFLSIRQPFEQFKLGNMNWSPGMENPADGLARVRSEMAPLFRLL